LPFFSIIAAIDKNNLIGRDNRLPWNIPEDLQFFRSITMGHPVVMGKNTWLSIWKPLEGRVNIILTRETELNVPGCIVVNTLEQIMDDFNSEELFIIGGASVFKQFLPIAQKIYLTRILHEFQGDTYFPSVDWDMWEIVFFEQKQSVEGYQLNFEQWQRKDRNNLTP